jgi:hypothetical protein
VENDQDLLHIYTVRTVLSEFGVEEAEDDEEWVVLWTDTTATLPNLLQLKRYQRCNHFPVRKSFLAQLLIRN